jgi:hypothetical protein
MGEARPDAGGGSRPEILMPRCSAPQTGEVHARGGAEALAFWFRPPRGGGPEPAAGAGVRGKYPAPRKRRVETKRLRANRTKLWLDRWSSPRLSTPEPAAQGRTQTQACDLRSRGLSRLTLSPFTKSAIRRVSDGSRHLIGARDRLLDVRDGRAISDLVDFRRPIL